MKYTFGWGVVAGLVLGFIAFFAIGGVFPFQMGRNAACAAIYKVDVTTVSFRHDKCVVLEPESERPLP